MLRHKDNPDKESEMRVQHLRQRRRIRTIAVAGVLATLVPLTTPTPVAASTKANIGGGFVKGTAVFQAPGIPPASANCQPTNFTLSGSSASGFVLNTVITGYLGEITLTGSGQASCTSVVNSDGPLTLTATGTGPTGSRLDCPTLQGTFTRTGLVSVIVLQGNCVVNQFGTGRVEFVATVGFVPDPPDSTNHIPRAQFAGDFIVRPAADE